MKGTPIVFRLVIRVIEGFISSQGYGFIEYEAQKVSFHGVFFYVTQSKALSINRMQMTASIHSTAATFKDVLSSWSLPRKIGGASPIWIARTL